MKTPIIKRGCVFLNMVFLLGIDLDFITRTVNLMNLGLLKRRELGFSIGDSSVIFGGVEDGFNIS